MNEYNDKSPTLEFDAVKEDVPPATKPQQNRSQGDEFTAARNGRGYEIYNSRKEKSNGALIGIASALTVLLVVAIVAGIFILKGDNESQNENALVVQDEPVKEPEIEEEIPEPQNMTVACNFVFYGVGIRENDGEYTVRAEMYDQEMYRFDSRDVIIDDDTDIRQDGKRLTPQALVYIIENSGGESLIFQGEIREKDGRMISISFETPIIEEPVEEEVPEEEATTQEGETETEAETPAQPVPEETPTETPVEEAVVQ